MSTLIFRINESSLLNILTWVQFQKYQILNECRICQKLVYEALAAQPHLPCKESIVGISSPCGQCKFSGIWKQIKKITCKDVECHRQHDHYWDLKTCGCLWHPLVWQTQLYIPELQLCKELLLLKNHLPGGAIYPILAIEVPSFNQRNQQKALASVCKY